MFCTAYSVCVDVLCVGFKYVSSSVMEVVFQRFHLHISQADIFVMVI